MSSQSSQEGAAQQGATPAQQPQQQGQAAPTSQQTAGTAPAPKPVIRDWAAI